MISRTTIASQQNHTEQYKIIQNITKASKSTQNLLDLQIGMAHQFLGKDIYVKQETIGKRTGVTRESANRICGYLHKIGLVLKQNRGYKKTCIYRINPAFQSAQFLKELYSKFPNMKYVWGILMLPSLMPFTGKFQGRSHKNINMNNMGIIRGAGAQRWDAQKDNEMFSKALNKPYHHRDEAYWKWRSTQKDIEMSNDFKKEIVEYARKVYDTAVANGKQIDNPAKYMLAICQRVVDRGGKIPSGGVNNSYTKEQVQSNIKNSLNEEEQFKNPRYPHWIEEIRTPEDPAQAQDNIKKHLESDAPGATWCKQNGIGMPSIFQNEP